MLPDTSDLPRKSNKVQNETIPELRWSLIRNLFLDPKSAFAIFFQTDRLGGKDIWLAHLSLFVLAPITKLGNNIFLILTSYVQSSDEETKQGLFTGVFSVFVFYLVVYILIRLVDSFRIYHQMRDRSKNWAEPEPYIFLISFLPFSATSLFWILPTPIPLLMLAVGFLYSLHLSYFYLSQVSHWSSADFFFFLMKVILFFLSLLSIPLFVYNLIRTVFF